MIVNSSNRDRNLSQEVLTWGAAETINSWTDELEDRWTRLLQLSESLRGGNVPTIAAPSGMNLQAGETVHAIVAVQRVEFFATQETYGTGFGVVGGGGPFGIAMLVASATGSLLVNHASKKNAERRAAEQWRYVDHGYLTITNQRLALHGASQWLDLWYSRVRMSECGANGFQVHLAGEHPIGFLMGYSDWFYYLFRYLSTEGRTCPKVVLADDLSQRRNAWLIANQK
jgi:hypothetical protein